MFAVLGGTLGDVKICFMVSIEVPIYRYFSGPQNYNPEYEPFGHSATEPLRSLQSFTRSEIMRDSAAHLGLGFRVFRV